MSQSDDHLDFIVRPGQGQGRNVDSNCLATLIREGFSHDKARRALEISVDNLTMAREILLNFTWDNSQNGFPKRHRNISDNI